MAKKHTDNELSKVNIAALSGEIGLKLAIPVTIFVLLGIRLDKTFQTTPLFIIVGMIIALCVSSVAVYRIVKRLEQESDET